MGGGLFIKRSWRQFDIVVITISGKFFVIPSLSRFKNVRDDNTKNKKKKNTRKKRVFLRSPRRGLINCSLSTSGLTCAMG